MLKWKRLLEHCWGLRYQKGNGKSKAIEEGVKGMQKQGMLGCGGSQGKSVGSRWGQKLGRIGRLASAV